MARRRQLMEMRVAEQNRSRGTPARIRAQIREHVEWLNLQIDELDHEIGHHVRSSPAWRERDDLYRSTPGVGPVLSATLLADLPELAPSLTSRSPPSSDWRHSIKTVATSADNA